MTKLSIIIVSYNTKDFIEKCIESIKKTSFGIDYEIIVVDNASRDESVEFIKKKFPQVKIIANKKNAGFSKANNQGVKKSKGEFVLFLNPDTVIWDKTLSAMIEFMEDHKDAGAATCKVQLASGDLDDASHRGFPTPWNSFAHFSGISKLFGHSKLFGGYSMGWKDLSQTHTIDALAGAFMLTRRIAGEEVGWWDEDFFWYGDDLDFCYRLKEKGWKIYYVPTVSILHYKGVSGGIQSHSKHLTTADKETKKRATKARFEAMRIFYKKHYTYKYPKIVNWLVVTGINLKEKL